MFIATSSYVLLLRSFCSLQSFRKKAPRHFSYSKLMYNTLWLSTFTTPSDEYDTEKRLRLSSYSSQEESSSQLQKKTVCWIVKQSMFIRHDKCSNRCLHSRPSCSHNLTKDWQPYLELRQFLEYCILVAAYKLSLLPFTQKCYSQLDT